MITSNTGSGFARELSPIPLRRMAWVVWRQHGFTLAALAALFGAAAAYLTFSGLQMQSAVAAVTACTPIGSTVCQQAATEFLNAYAQNVGITTGVLQLIPALIGAFVGAPLLASEFESGTFRYAFTQGIGRARWLIAKLATLGVAVAIAAAALSTLISWWYGPLIAAGDQNGRMLPTIFDLLGPACVAWTLLSFATGVVAGVLIRRVIPAMFASIATWGALAFVTAILLRPHYWTPLVSSDPNGAQRGWVLSREWLRNGQPVSLDAMNRTLAPIDVRAVTAEIFQPGPSTPANLDPAAYLIQHGYTHLTTYLPDSWFWPFQWIEAGWLLVACLVLIATAIWLVRRRAA